MLLIIKSIPLSFAVLVRMIIPTIGILFLVTLTVLVLGPLTLGLAAVVAVPVMAVLIALYGIRAALELLGDRSPTDHKSLLLSACIFAVILAIAKAVTASATGALAIIFADWSMGDLVSASTYQDANRETQAAFELNLLGAFAAVTLFLSAATSALLAIPMANAARAAGRGSHGGSFFSGFGGSFVPLLLVYLVAQALQYVFGVFQIFFAFIPFLLALSGPSVFAELAEMDVTYILWGVGAASALLWLYAWTWAACALALEKSEKAARTSRSVLAHVAQTPEIDIRALRKSRG